MFKQKNGAVGGNASIKEGGAEGGHGKEEVESEGEGSQHLILSIHISREEWQSSPVATGQSPRNVCMSRHS